MTIVTSFVDPPCPVCGRHPGAPCENLRTGGARTYPHPERSFGLVAALRAEIARLQAELNEERAS